MTNEKINMKENYTETIKVETDEEGNILVECRECAKEFKMLYEFITAENPRIVCPHCNKEKSKVNLTKKDREKIFRIFDCIYSIGGNSTFYWCSKISCIF